MFLATTALALLLATTTTADPGGPAAGPAPEVRLAVGHRITDGRMAAPRSDATFADGESVTAWSEVKGARPGALQHVWYHDGVEVVRHDAATDKGRSRRFSTRHRVYPGIWEVRVLDAEGRELALASFLVADPDFEHDCGA
jgi:hypothetical protein